MKSKAHSMHTMKTGTNKIILHNANIKQGVESIILKENNARQRRKEMRQEINCSTCL